MALDIEIIRVRHEKSTAGEWYVDTAKDDEEDHESPDLVCASNDDVDADGANVARCYPRVVRDHGGDRHCVLEVGNEYLNASFIAHAHEDVPALIAEIEALRTTLEQARGAFMLTRIYVGAETLPAVDGWSWFDAVTAIDAALGDVDTREILASIEAGKS